jgi:hypothetical protein
MRVGRSIVAGALALSLLPIGAAVAAPASAAPAVAQDISFDGYCDGLHVNIPSAGLGTTGTLDGTETGCYSSGAFGTASPNKLGRFGVTKGNEYVQYEDAVGHPWLTVIKKNHTWTHYILDGLGHLAVLNSGTWSLGTPVRQAGRVGSASGAARPQVSAPQSVDVRIDIVFDGYCDGMRLKIPSTGLGTAGTIDGRRTGCESAPIMGAVAKVNGLRDWVVDDVNGPFQFGIFEDGTFVIYVGSGGLESVLNAGTWSYGTPVARGAASTG